MRENDSAASLLVDQKPLTSPDEVAQGIETLRRLIVEVKELRQDDLQCGSSRGRGDEYRVPEEVFQFHARREVVMAERHIRESITEIFGKSWSMSRKFQHFRIDANTKTGVEEAIATLENLVFQLEEKRLSLIGASRQPLPQSNDIDPLTDLYSRRLLDRYIIQELDRSQRYGYSFVLVFFSLRNWRGLHIAHGSFVSNAVLVRMACACKASLRGYDYAARIAEDEFAIWLPQSDGQGACSLSRRIAEKFEKSIVQLGLEVNPKLEFGMASFPFDGDTPASLFYTAITHRMSFTPDLSEIKITPL